MKLTSLGSTRRKKGMNERESETRGDNRVRSMMREEDNVETTPRKSEYGEEIWNTYNMMIEKFLELGEIRKTGDEFEIEKARAIAQLYADRADELLEEFREYIEKRKNENLPIEEINETMLRDAEIMWVRRTEEWNNFRCVSNMMMNLRIARVLARDEGMDRRIGDLMLAYIKRSEVLTKMAEGENGNSDIDMEEAVRKEECNIKTEQKPIYLDSNEVQESMTSDGVKDKVLYEMDKSATNEREDESIAESMRDNFDASVYSEMSTVSGKRTNDQKSGNDESQLSKKVKTNPKRPTLRDLVKVNDISNNNNNEVRIRFQFVYKGGTTLKKGSGEQVKELLYKMMTILKMSDRNTCLMPWRKKDNIGNLSGEEIRLITKEQIMHYIDLNSTEENLKSGKKYFMNGIRLKTRYTVATVIRKWEEQKYKNKGEDEFFKTTVIKEAEMQNSDTAYAVGYMMGTTEKGIYSTFAKEISQLTGVETEVSYQIVNQRGITNSIWQLAKEKAEKRYPNPFSREHRRMKFKFSPYALVVYVAKEEDISKARKSLFEKLGQVSEGQWPIVADGSRMKFVPIMQENIESEDVVKFLHEGLYIQAMSKGNEETFELPIKDIYEPKSYLKNQSLEQVIHLMTKDNEGTIPIFKHITRKWTSDPEEMKYEVVCQSSFKEDARQLLKNLQEILEEKYGIDVRRHFLAPIQMIRVKNKLEGKKTKVDKELEMMITTSQTDQYGMFLLEGMERATNDMKERNEKKQNKADTIKNGYNSDDTLSNTSTISTESKDSKTIQFSESAEYGNELTAESCVAKMRDHVARYGITLEEIKYWVERYHEHEEKLMRAQDIDDVLENINLKEWKDMRGGILAKRNLESIQRRAERKKKQKQETPAYERPDPQLDEALSKMDIDIPKKVVVNRNEDNNTKPSNSNTNTISQVSHLSDYEAPQQPKKKRSWGGGGR